MLGYAGLVSLMTALLAVPHHCADVISCTSDADCSNQTRCVTHRNYALQGQCDTNKYCIPVNGTSCSCRGGHKCRIRDCPTAPYECLLLENEETRCGGSQAPKCPISRYCAYGFVGRKCKRCPCYGTHQAFCVTKRFDRLCSPNSIVRVDDVTGYTCDACVTAASVLTGPPELPA
ncbi:uncharacterized protein LOC144135395 [Amblyomma americanum]